VPTLNELLHAASRTFAIGIDLLPRPLRSEVEIAYLLLRVSDYLEDNVSMGPDRKAALLREWADVLAERAPLDGLGRTLAGISERTPDALVARNVVQIHGALVGLDRPEARRIVERHVRDSTLGMARWVERGPAFADEADLDDYMHEVAGRVGWLLTELFALEIPAVSRHHDEMMHLGREFGLALQTVNVIRGLHSDWERGWVYIPASFLNGRGLPADVVRGGGATRDVEESVLEQLVRKASRHLDAAQRYISKIPARQRGVRLFCLLPYFFAVRTLAMSASNPSVFRQEVKIGRPEVLRIAKATRALGWSNAWVRWYAGSLWRTAAGSS
jgi:farnesyl-diphosphate farnesyltransferase